MSAPRGRLFIILLGVALLTLHAARDGAAQGFGQNNEYDTANGPHGIAIGDVNRDGRPDFVTADYYNGSTNLISVLLGAGDGTFASHVDFVTGTYPTSVALGDFNSDGNLDAVTTSVSPLGGEGGNYVSILLGNGDGTFGARTNYTTAPGPYYVRVGDLNGDGKLDIVTANHGFIPTYNTISVLLGTGGGAFGANTDYTVGSAPSMVAIGDLDGDGKPDLAVANEYGSSVSVLIGTGTGTFGTPTTLLAGNNPRAIEIADMNRDGKRDLVVGNSTSIGIYLNDGSGGFGAATTYGSGFGADEIAVADFNDDGLLDVAQAAPPFVYGAISVLLGAAGGGLAPYVEFGTLYQPHALAVGDFNLDGRPDLATTGGGANAHKAAVLLNLYPPPVLPLAYGRTDYASGNFPEAVATADLNADGKLDLASANANANSTSILLGSGTGTFGARTDFATGVFPNFIAIGDLNADGKPDLATANTNVGTMSVLLGSGGGSFGAFTNYNTHDGPRAVAIGDVNMDGKPDLAVANGNSTDASVFLGTGGGAFGPRTDFATGSFPYGIAISDLSGDGKPDLAVANSNSNSVSVLLGTGTGSFGSKTDFATAANPRGVVVADLNSDGKPDLVTPDVIANKISVLLGTGGGSFGPKTDFTTGSGPVGVAVGDLNWDGKLDVATANQSSNSVSVLLGTGTGSFSPKVDFGVGGFPQLVAIGDFNRDGRPDLAAANLTSNTVSVLIYDTTAPAAFVIQPNGGGTVNSGVPTPISFTATDNIAVHHVNLYYSLNSGSSFTLIAANQPPTSPYSWTVPAIATVNTVRVRVVAFDAAANSVADTSDADFSIVDASAPLTHVVSPNGGEVVSPGGALKITWTASDNVAVHHVDLHYSADGGATYNPIAASEANDGTYAWMVPTTQTTQARVRVVAFDASGNSSADGSDADFTIADVNAPAIPSPFTGVFSGGPVQLHWGANMEPDFAVYHLHRGGTAGFVPAPGNLVVSQADTGYVDAGSTWSYYKLSALDAYGNESPFAALAPGGSSSGSTPAGDSVVVSPSPMVGLTFQNVSGGGQTQLTLQTGGSPPPGGLKLAPGAPPLYYVITTTATFTGTVTVCVNYDPEFITGQEKNLKLMHYDILAQPPGWVQVTTSRDTAANLICGTVTHFSEFALMETDGTVAVEEEKPSAVQLYSCAPNPVSGTAQILYGLPVASAVRLSLFDLQGRWVRDLERQPMMGAGRHAVQWDGRGAHGEQLRAGVYLLWLETGGARQTRRVVVTR